jgi:hypothetical protein
MISGASAPFLKPHVTTKCFRMVPPKPRQLRSPAVQLCLAVPRFGAAGSNRYPPPRTRPITLVPILAQAVFRLTKAWPALRGGAARPGRTCRKGARTDALAPPMVLPRDQTQSTLFQILPRPRPSTITVPPVAEVKRVVSMSTKDAFQLASVSSTSVSTPPWKS